AQPPMATPLATLTSPHRCCLHQPRCHLERRWSLKQEILIWVRRTERRSKRSRRKKKHNSWIVHIFNYQCYLTFITGCYTCQWKVQKEKRLIYEYCCCSRREQIFCLFLIFSAGLSVLLLFLWLESSNEFVGFDWYRILVLLVYRSPEYLWDPDCLFFVTVGADFANNSGRVAFIVAFIHFLEREVADSWAITAGLCSLLTLEQHMCDDCSFLAYVQSRRYQMIHYERKRKTRKRYNVFIKLRAMQVALGLPFFLLILSFYAIPFGKYSPCIQEKDKLGPKPDLFGHRGAPMLGPENTMMSFEKAVEQGAFGLETDVYLSYDGVPFLMHDYDLRRTTNIKDVLPSAAFLSGTNFTWNFLSTLNAGKWFLQSPPFYNMKPLPEADSEKAGSQMIPKLSEFLELARKEKKFVIFDLNAPPAKHPFRGMFVRETVQVILDSKIEQHLIFWLPGFDRAYVRNKAPGFQHVGRLIPVETLTKEKIRIINVDYKKMFYNGLRDYKAANITINLYIVNEPWLYSLAWCSSIHSVTTDNIQNLRHINHPYFFMTPGDYRFWWLLLDSISVISVITIFYYHW
ncbi:Glycerophosphodiester phosphodiesterase domain-containing protein 4, partial [Galemys pyrenaicus]